MNPDSRRQALRARLLDLAEPALEELARQLTNPGIDPETKRDLALQIIRDSGVASPARASVEEGSRTPLEIPAVAEALKGALQGLGFAFGVRMAESKLDSIADSTIPQTRQVFQENQHALEKPLYSENSIHSIPAQASKPLKGTRIPGLRRNP